MASICPRCKSLMVNGRCTKKQCMATVLDIEHSLLEDELRKQFKNIGSIKNIYSSTYYEGQQALYDKDNIGDKYGFTTVEKNWFKLAKERNIDINVSCLTNEATDEDGFLLQTIKEVKYSEIRKFAKAVKKYNILHIIRFGKGRTFNIVWGSNDGVKWENISKISDGISAKSPLNDVPLALITPLDCLMQQWTNWAVAIKSKEHSVEIRYSINKDQAYEIFKNREIKEGKRRRTALRHYVGEYAKEDGKLIEAYLRCDPRFEWNGMQCEIIVPIAFTEVVRDLRN